MKKFKISFFIILFCLSLTASSQTNNVIILWDVTWSMKGHVGHPPGADASKPNIDSTKRIWEPTKENIIETIEKLPVNGSYNVKIIPFEDPNDPAGFSHEIKDIRSLDRIEQQDLIDWVRKYDGSPFDLRKGTNVCQALDNVFSSIAQQQRYDINNQILLLSDGGQSARNSGFNNETCLDEQLSKFCKTYCAYQNQQETNRLYLYKLKYVQSTIQCPCISEPKRNSNCMFTKYITLNPTPTNESISYSEIINSLDLNIRFSIFGSDLPNDFRIEVTSSDPEINVIAANFENDNLNLKFNLDNLNLDSGSERSTILSFIGYTDEKCYGFNIKPFKFTVVNQKISKVIIGKVEPIRK